MGIFCLIPIWAHSFLQDLSWCQTKVQPLFLNFYEPRQIFCSFEHWIRDYIFLFHFSHPHFNKIGFLCVCYRFFFVLSIINRVVAYSCWLLIISSWWIDFVLDGTGVWSSDWIFNGYLAGMRRVMLFSMNYHCFFVIFMKSS